MKSKPTKRDIMIVEHFVKVEARKALTEASPVEFSTFPKDKQKIVNNIAKHFEATIVNKSAFDGIHGLVISFQNKRMTYGVRFDANDLKFLAQTGIRWIEPESNGSFTIGL